MIPKINSVEAKSIFIKSGLPGSDWVINPYNGCLFGCMYCYAAQIARWKHPDEEWGTYLDVKKNAPELLPEFQKADTRKYREKLELIIKKAMRGRNLKMGLGKVIYHRKLAKKN